MRYWVHDSDIREDGTLLREEPGQVPEVFSRETLEWAPAPALYTLPEGTAEWDLITAHEAKRIEQHKRAVIA